MQNVTARCSEGRSICREHQGMMSGAAATLARRTQEYEQFKPQIRETL